MVGFCHGENMPACHDDDENDDNNDNDDNDNSKGDENDANGENGDTDENDNNGDSDDNDDGRYEALEENAASNGICLGQPLVLRDDNADEVKLSPADGHDGDGDDGDADDTDGDDDDGGDMSHQSMYCLFIKE